MHYVGMIGKGILAGATAIASFASDLGGTKIENKPTISVEASPQTNVNPTFSPTTQQNPTLNSVFSPQINFFNGTSPGNTAPSPSTTSHQQHEQVHQKSSDPRVNIGLPQLCIASGLCIATLLYNFMKMRRLELFLQDAHNRWFTWKHEIPIVTFAQTPRIE
jgi:hypothetical protein